MRPARFALNRPDVGGVEAAPTGPDPGAEGEELRLGQGGRAGVTVTCFNTISVSWAFSEDRRRG